MELKIRFKPLELSKSNFQRTLKIIEETIPFELGLPFTFYQKYPEQQSRIDALYNKLHVKYSLATYPDNIVEDITNILDEMVELLYIFDFDAANKLCDLSLAWDDTSPVPWHHKGKILYQQFVLKQIDNFDQIIEIFTKVVELVERYETHYELGFWAYSFMANLYLYRILSGQEALEHAMKRYNQAYRFAQINEIDVEDDFIFENVDILQQILMNQYPLLVIIYNDTGLKIYEYLFQFVEVMTEDQRFIPNFTALLSVVDERIKSLFKSSINNAYIIIENRLMVISTLYSENQQEWVKVAMVFSYLHQSADEVEINQTLLNKISKFKSRLIDNPDILSYINNFNGKFDDNVHQSIEQNIQEIFS